jgi:O-antigen/teichoic acid export membrane protein
LRAELSLWGELLRKGLPFAYAGAVITAFFQVDQVMIEQIRGPLEVGWYGVPARVLEGLTIVPRIIGYAFIPTMAALFATDPAAVTDLYRRGVRYLLLIGLPISAFGLISSEPFVVLLSGESYRPSAAAAQLLLPAALFMFLSNFGETTLACINRWRTIVVISTVTLVINVSLNLLWIPEYGFRGAAVATVITELTYLVLTAISLHRYGHRIPWLSLPLRPLLATAAFAGVLYATRGLGLIPSSVAASLVYAGAAWGLRLWGPDELRTVRELMRRRQGGDSLPPTPPPAP